jgi:cytochrome b6-f complex subunit 5
MEEWRSAKRDSSPMIEPLLCGIVLGLIPVTLLGLFMAAWNQYRRGSLLDS